MKRGAEPDGPPLVLTGEGMIWLGATVLLGGVGWYKSINLVLVLAYLMFAVLVLNGIMARAHARRVSALRGPTTHPFAREEVAVRVYASNTGNRPATAAVVDRTGEVASAWILHNLPAGSTATFATRRAHPRRGRHPNTLRVSSAFPFGLLRYDNSGVGGEVVVLPAAGVADPDGLRRWIVTHAGGDGRARKVLRRVTTDQADVRGVRPYRPGDSIRTVHWKCSARRGELMVREYDAAPAPDLVLVVEPWLPAEPSASERRALEAALSLAVTIVRTWSQVYGTRVTVAMAGDTESVRTTMPTDVGTRDALEALAVAAGAATFATFGPELFDRQITRSARLVVSSRAGSSHADALTRSTGRRFLALCPIDRLPWYQPPNGGGDE